MGQRTAEVSFSAASMIDRLPRPSFGKAYF